MKKVKLLTTLLLSGASIAALASCGTNTYPGVNKPGVSVLVGRDDSSKYLSYEVKGGEENLKFGETDVVVTITPNKFYSFYYFVSSKEPDAAQYWGRSGYLANEEKSTFRTSVYLGSRNTPVRYRLAENVAWTITNESTFDENPVIIDGQEWKLVKEEKFTIKVKKEFFQKAITIDLSLGNPSQHTLLSTYGPLFNSSDNGFVVTSSDQLNEAVTYSFSDSDFAVLNDNNAMVLVYDINSNRIKSGAENGKVIATLKNELLSFNGYDQLDKDKKYSKFEVIGVKKSDHTEETLSVYDPKKEEQDFEVEVTNAGNRIIFYLKWTSLIEAKTGDPYNEKYENFKVKLTPSPILDIKVNYSTKDAYKTQDGFYNKYMTKGENHLHIFSRGQFYLQHDSTSEPMDFGNIGVTSTDASDASKSAPYFIFVKGKESVDGSPTWPTVDINYEDINGKTITQSIGTTVIDSPLFGKLKYCENGYWRIVCINSGDNQSKTDPWGKKANNLFVIYPLYSTASFYMPDGGANLAKSVTINVGNI